jgi:hypothetical protein
VQGGGAVWCRGGIDGRLDEVYADIYPEDSGDDFGSVYMRYSLRVCRPDERSHFT